VNISFIPTPAITPNDFNLKFVLFNSGCYSKSNRTLSATDRGGTAPRDRKKAGIEDMTSGAGAMVATAMRVVNAVPYVVAAEPGLLSSVDLPLTIPTGAFSRPE
jgi:hypothetical protein